MKVLTFADLYPEERRADWRQRPVGYVYAICCVGGVVKVGAAVAPLARIKSQVCPDTGAIRLSGIALRRHRNIASFGSLMVREVFLSKALPNCAAVERALKTNLFRFRIDDSTNRLTETFLLPCEELGQLQRTFVSDFAAIVSALRRKKNASVEVNGEAVAA